MKTEVRKCHICGQPSHLCTCEDEDLEYDGETFDWGEFEGDEILEDDFDNATLGEIAGGSND